MTRLAALALIGGSLFCLGCDSGSQTNTTQVAVPETPQEKAKPNAKTVAPPATAPPTVAP